MIRYIILGLLTLASAHGTTQKVDFKEPACNVTFAAEANECTTLIKCTTEHEKLLIRHKNKIGKYAVYAIWQPGDTTEFERDRGPCVLTVICNCPNPGLHQDLCCHLCAEYNKYRN